MTINISKDIKVSSNIFENDEYKIPKTDFYISASIPAYNSIVGDKVDIAEQLVDINRNIITRTFREYKVENNEATIEYINLGYYEDLYEGSSYYQVVTQYEELEYTAPITLKEEDKFYKWDVDKIIYRKETHYKPSIIKNILWEREEIQSKTGTEYVNLPDPFVLIFDANKAIGANFSQLSGNYIVKLKDNIEDEIGDIIENPLNNFTCYKRYIEVTFTNVNDFPLNPINVSINFLGEAVLTYSIPLDNQELYTLVHPEGTELNTRLFPPGKENSFPSNFWNNADKPPLINAMSERIGEPNLISN